MQSSNKVEKIKRNKKLDWEQELTLKNKKLNKQTRKPRFEFVETI